VSPRNYPGSFSRKIARKAVVRGCNKLQSFQLLSKTGQDNRRTERLVLGAKGVPYPTKSPHEKGHYVSHSFSIVEQGGVAQLHLRGDVTVAAAVELCQTARRLAAGTGGVVIRCDELD